MPRLFFGCLLFALVLTGAMPPVAAQQSRPVVIFAAASLQTTLGAVAAAWTAETGKTAAFSFAASSALARQLDNGAPADVFASADLDWMDWAEGRRLIVGPSRRNLLGNRLVLITAAGAQASLAEVELRPGLEFVRLLGDSRLALGDPVAVPAGRYAQAALQALGLWDVLKTRIAGAESVRAALALVARGEARLGIVYATDARAERRVRTLATFPADTHPPIVYPFALTAASTHPDAAAFLAYLSSPKARAIFEADGFQMLAP